MPNNTFNRDLEINRTELDILLERAIDPSLVSAGKETVVWNKDSVMNQVNEHLAKARANEQSNPEYITDWLSNYMAKEERRIKYEIGWYLSTCKK